MVDVVTTGTGAACNFNRNMAIAGKTGTTTDYWDVWFAGYTPYYTCASWAGYDNNIEMSRSSGNREDHVARDLWRAVMSRIHENLANEQFTVPQGIVNASICTLSGKLPIPGICDNTTRTEIFAEGTVPTENCTVHYRGILCDYDHIPACPNCPFQVEGTCDLPLQEDPALLSGSSGMVVNPDGTVTPPSESIRCQHDDAFYANPDYEAIIDAQSAEIEQRRIDSGFYDHPEEDEEDEE